MTKAGGRSRKKEKKGEDNGIIVDDLPLLFWWEKGCILVVAIVVALFFQGYIAFEVISGQFGDVADTANPMFEELQATVDNFKKRTYSSKVPKEEHWEYLRDSRKHALVRISVPGEGDVYLQNNGYHEGHAGHTRLPDIFYRGVFFGLSAWNAHIDEERDSERDDAWTEDIEEDIWGMEPKPDFVAPCEFSSESHDWYVEALCPYYDLDGREEIDKMMLMHKMRLLGRVYHQPVIYSWWTHRWGGKTDAEAVIMQSVHPTTSHHPALKSHAPVWRSPGVQVGPGN